MLKSGDILDGRYQIMNEIGKGGTGIVYLGYHLTLCKYVVIKKIKDNFVGNINARGEVDILKKLHHRYLPQVYDFLVIGNGVYTILDYVDGHDLEWFVKEGYVFTENQMRHLLVQLCEVLQYLHSQNPPIIHSDIKPGNIMIRSDGDACLIDFNISLDGEEQTVIGYSAQFAAPEQIELSQAILYGKPQGHLKVDERSDIYSLGATFYYLMTGIYPSDLANYVPASKLSLMYSKELSRVIDKAMERARQKRYASAVKMLTEVQNGNVGRKHALIAGLMMLVMLLVIGGIIAGGYQIRKGRQQRFREAFSEFQKEQFAGDLQKIRDVGIYILNERDYCKLLEENGLQKAEILGGIAESYYQEENYYAALTYYEEALEAIGEGERRKQYLRDYIISLNKAGQEQKAYQELEKVQKLLDSDIFSYLQAEFLLEKGEKVQALSLLLQVLEESSDREIRFRCYLQAADCMKEMGKDEERLQMLKKAEALLDNILLYRHLAEAYVDIAQNNDTSTIHLDALGAAKRCYVFLNQQQTASYLDRLNYATVLEMTGEYQKSFAILQLLEQNFPDDYRTYRQEAFLCYRIEMAKTTQSRDFQSVLYYGRLAEEHCNAAQSSDERMAQLKELLQRLSN